MKAIFMQNTNKSKNFFALISLFSVTATYFFFRKYASHWKIFQIAYRLWPGISEYKHIL